MSSSDQSEGNFASSSTDSDEEEAMKKREQQKKILLQFQSGLFLLGNLEKNMVAQCAKVCPNSFI